MRHRPWGLLLWALTAGCSGPETPDAGVAFFPADYASYVEVRDCRSSGDHQLNRIRILVNPTGLHAYRSRDAGFPEGSVVLKEEREFADGDCSGPIQQWTVMRRVADGGRPQTLDWEWQVADAQRVVTEENTPGCANCHRACGRSPDGFEGTCALP